MFSCLVSCCSSILCPASTVLAAISALVAPGVSSFSLSLTWNLRATENLISRSSQRICSITCSSVLPLGPCIVPFACRPQPSVSLCVCTDGALFLVCVLLRLVPSYCFLAWPSSGKALIAWALLTLFLLPLPAFHFSLSSDGPDPPFSMASMATG